MKGETSNSESCKREGPCLEGTLSQPELGIYTVTSKHKVKKKHVKWRGSVVKRRVSGPTHEYTG